MSKRCAKQLTRRQQLISRDYQASRGLAQACQKEIRDNRCKKGLKKGDGGDKVVKLTQILLCLEGALRSGDSDVGPECQRETLEHRRMLMEDFQISPEIVDACKVVIQQFCTPLRLGGQTIHCLMKVASTHDMEAAPTCENALRKLLREANVVQDWKVDPILQASCQDVVIAGCDPKAGNDVVMSCLMSLAATNSHHMNKECKRTLLEIQYFIARDFALDPKLYRKCARDAQEFCAAEEDWYEKATQPDFKAASLVFPCLVR